MAWACDSGWINLQVTNEFDWDDLDFAAVSGTDAQASAGFGPASVATGRVVITASKQVLTPPSGSVSRELFKVELPGGLFWSCHPGDQFKKPKIGFGANAYGVVLGGVIVLVGH